MTAEKERADYDELCAYSLSLRDAKFIHQLVVDAWAAQHVDEKSKPIGIAFALIGLYLHLEKGYSGKEVQRAHMRLANRRKQWPRFTVPASRGNMTASDVLAIPPGPDREHAIERWCVSVWHTWRESHEQVRELVRQELR